MTTALSHTLDEAAKAIKNASKYLCPNQVTECLSLLDSCYERKSKVLISGVGKSGIVARKIAATFSSIGLMAVYINPLDALHGDIGVMHSLDVCLLLSNSGETNEILDLIFHVKKRGIKVISLVGCLESSIAKKSDVVLFVNVDKEFCPLNLAPTASTTVALAIGDSIAIEWMLRKKITVEDFAINHPAGALGRKISLQVSDLMIPLNQLNILSFKDDIQTVIFEMTRNGLGICLIKNPVDKKILGIITDGDLRRALEKYNPIEWEQLKASSFMTPNPISIKEDKLAIDALSLMENDKENLISILVVVDNLDSVVGLLRMHEIIQAGLKSL